MNPIKEFIASLPEEIIMHGGHNENVSQITLRAGCLSMDYENGSLRHISAGGTEIIRMIYSAVRDKEWLTIIPLISDEEADVKKDCFTIRYKCNYQSGEINFSADYYIEGKKDNSLIFGFEGEALNDFTKNRIGFCVLHPIEGSAGEDCIIQHTNFQSENLKFPKLIDPRQPFKDIRSMKWASKGLTCTLDFFGDVFETEDQRNWTDASFKTYCTPLDKPFPAVVQKGEKIKQRCEFKLEGVTELQKTENKQIRLTLHPGIISHIPRIGIGRSTRSEPLTEDETQFLKTIRFNHYRADLYLFHSDWKAKAEHALTESSLLGYALEFALFFDDNASDQVNDFTQWVTGKHIDFAIFDIYHKNHLSTPDKLTDSIAPKLKNACPDAKISCGTNANFAQLNRARPGSLQSDFICYSIHPQEHASDNISLTENLQGQYYTVESARKFADGKVIWISPVTMQRRFNANIENFETPGDHTKFPSGADSRLMSLFGACWATGSMKYLFESGVNGVTFFETVGERGIYQGDLASLWPEKFRTVRKMIFPVFHLFDYLLQNKSMNVIRSESSSPLKVDLLALSDEKYLKLILVNFTQDIQRVLLSDNSGEASFKQLNADTFAEASADRNWLENSSEIILRLNKEILLKPFSINFIEERV
jgi:D-apionolactonase